MGENFTNMVLLALLWYVAFLISTTLHEAAHAWSAKLLGDATAYQGGQATLSPLPHIQREPVGMVGLPLISVLLSGGNWLFGWGSAPYDVFWARRFPRRAALMALAGPLANLLLLLVAAGLIHLGIAVDVFRMPQATKPPYVVVGPEGEPTPLAALPSILFLLNLVLLIFNLLPFPPLDGTSVIQLFMPEETAVRWQEFSQQPAVSLGGILLAGVVFNTYYGTIFLSALNTLYPGQQFH